MNKKAVRDAIWNSSVQFDEENFIRDFTMFATHDAIDLLSQDAVGPATRDSVRDVAERLFHSTGRFSDFAVSLHDILNAACDIKPKEI